MDHHHGHLGVTRRNHVLDVHLVDGDLIVRAEAAKFDGGLLDLFAADVEAATRFENQRAVGGADVAQALRLSGTRPQQAEQRRADGALARRARLAGAGLPDRIRR